MARRWPGARALYVAWTRATFRSSGEYWQRRYSRGGTSGAGSYGAQARWKGETVSDIVRELGAESVVELGCGDGNQLRHCSYPRYLGLDVSSIAVRRCAELFGDDPTKSFARYDPDALVDPAGWFRADVAVSLEVIFHLVEDEVFETYLRHLFDLARSWVLICSTDRDDLPRGAHERHRVFTRWVAEHRPQWELVRTFHPPADVDLLAGVYLYARRDAAAR